MKKYVLLVFILFTVASFAQYNLIPGNTFTQYAKYNDLQYGGIDIVNTSGKKLYLNWTLISQDTISGCYFDLCESGTCYLGIPATGVFTPLDSGAAGWLKMHFWTGSKPGISKARVYIYETGKPNQGDTLTNYLIVSASGVGNSFFSSAAELNIQPNPAVNYIQISISNPALLFRSVYFFNSSGQAVFPKSSGAANYDISMLASGIYFVKAIGEDNLIYSSVFIKE